MNKPYQDSQTALKYLDFLNSTNGKIQQKVLLEAILPALPKNNQTKILDAGCGSGWLSRELKKTYGNTQGCDASEFLVRFALTHSKGVDFKVASLAEILPYPGNYFDAVILNMVGPDLENLESAFTNTAAVLRQGGKLIMTVPNPAYTYPAAEWKRGWLNALLLQKPKLKLKNPPAAGEKIQREFGKNSKITSYYYTLGNYASAAANAGLKLKHSREIRSGADSRQFDLNYQLFRYPLILLLEFGKEQ